MKKAIIAICAFSAISLILLAVFYNRLDVVGNDAHRAFSAVANALPPEEGGFDWSLISPDREAEFCWDSGSAGVLIDTRPFEAAGLDISKLGNAGNDVMFIGVDFKSTGEDLKTSDAVGDFGSLIKAGRSSLGYHTAMDHYNISLGNGNMFEWAKDLDVNGNTNENQDKDIVFVLNPEPLIEAGVDPEKVNGWSYAEVAVMDNGRAVNVWKFLKPVDLS